MYGAIHLNTVAIANKEVNLNCVKKGNIYSHLGFKMNFETACFLLTIFTTICSQSLYDTNYQQHNVFNRGNSEVVFQSLLDETEDILKETMSKMQRCVDLGELRSAAYEGLLKMYSKGQFPNGKIFKHEYCKCFMFNK